jgi:hypothetical protein
MIILRAGEKIVLVVYRVCLVIYLFYGVFFVKIMMFEDCPCVDEGMSHRSLLPPMSPGRQLSSTGLFLQRISKEDHTLSGCRGNLPIPTLE